MITSYHLHACVSPESTVFV